MIEKRKAFAYITRGNQLLVFEHPHEPQAGIQVPAGTLEPGETPEAGVLREAYEETNLSGLKIVRFLGEQRRDMSEFGIPQPHHRHFYHLICEQPTPDTWEWGERTPSDQPGVVSDTFLHIFRFYWVDLSAPIPTLIADHDFFLPTLRQHLEV